MKKEITLLLSGYAQDNESLKKKKETADELLLSGRFQEGRILYAEIRLPWYKDIDSLASRLAVEPDIVGLAGIYAGVLEPSLMVSFEFEDETHWKLQAATLKRGLVEFGEKYNQLNVHLLDFAAKRPPSVSYGELIDDYTYQRKLWIRLKNVKYDFSNGNDNYPLLKEIVQESNLKNLTFHDAGVAIIVYSLGSNGAASFESDCAHLIAVLQERDMIMHISEGDVRLTNYGKFSAGGLGLGQSHSYSEARKCLDSTGSASGAPPDGKLSI